MTSSALRNQNVNIWCASQVYKIIRSLRFSSTLYGYITKQLIHELVNKLSLYKGCKLYSVKKYFINKLNRC